VFLQAWDKSPKNKELKNEHKELNIKNTFHANHRSAIQKQKSSRPNFPEFLMH